MRAVVNTIGISSSSTLSGALTLKRSATALQSDSTGEKKVSAGPGGMINWPTCGVTVVSRPDQSFPVCRRVGTKTQNPSGPVPTGAELDQLLPHSSSWAGQARRDRKRKWAAFTTTAERKRIAAATRVSLVAGNHRPWLTKMKLTDRTGRNGGQEIVGLR